MRSGGSVTAVTGVCAKAKEAEFVADSDLQKGLVGALATMENTKVVGRRTFVFGANARAIDKARLPLENRRFSPLRGRIPMAALLTTNLGDTPLLGRGKVRDLYAVDGALLLVATDRISAFDHVLGTGIPDKGKILTQISLFWFDLLKDLVPNHLITADVKEFPAALQPYARSVGGPLDAGEAGADVSGGVRGARLSGGIGLEGVSGVGNGMRHSASARV